MLDNQKRAGIISLLLQVVRWVLVICIMITSTWFLAVTFSPVPLVFESMLTLIGSVTFYSVMFGTLPALGLLIGMVLRNRYRPELSDKPKTEIQLLITNLILIVVSSLIFWIKLYFFTPGV